MDPTTVIAILAFNLLCAAGLFLAIARRLPPRQGLGLYAASMGVLALAFALRLLLGLPSGGWWTAVPDTLMLASALLLVAGLREQTGRERGHARQLAALLGGFAAIQLLALAVSGPLGRHVWLNLALGATYSVMAGEALHEARHGPDVLRRPLRVLTALTAGLASLTLARSLWTVIAGTVHLYDGWPAQVYFGYVAAASLLLVPTLHWMVFCRVEEQLQGTARRDPVTGVLNRQGFEEAVNRHWGTRPLRSLTVLHLDIDQFKAINDAHGHAVGDRLLQAVGRTLGSAVRGGDLLARVGGEEFLVACIDMHPLAARSLADRLREAVAQVALPVPSLLTNLSCTASVGVSRPCDAAHKFSGACREAAQALLAAQQAGRDRVRMVSTLHEVQLEPVAQTPSADARRRSGGAAAAAAATAATLATTDGDAGPDTTPEGLLHEDVVRTVPDARAAD